VYEIFIKNLAVNKSNILYQNFNFNKKKEERFQQRARAGSAVALEKC